MRKIAVYGINVHIIINLIYFYFKSWITQILSSFMNYEKTERLMVCNQINWWSQIFLRLEQIESMPRYFLSDEMISFEKLVPVIIVAIQFCCVFRHLICLLLLFSFFIYNKTYRTLHVYMH